MKFLILLVFFCALSYHFTNFGFCKQCLVIKSPRKLLDSLCPMLSSQDNRGIDYGYSVYIKYIVGVQVFFILIIIQSQ